MRISLILIETLCHNTPKWGHYGPDDHKQPRCFYKVGAMTIKIHDFVSFHV